MSFCSIGLGIVAFGQKSLEQLLGDLPAGPMTFCQSETGTTWKRNQSFVHLFSFSKKSTRIQMTAAQSLLVRQIFLSEGDAAKIVLQLIGMVVASRSNIGLSLFVAFCCCCVKHSHTYLLHHLL